VFKRFLPELNDKQFLLLMRCTIVACAAATLTFALNSDASIYEMVGSAYCVTLVAAVVPLFAGLFWTRATTQGALASIAFGLVSWIYLEFTWTEEAFWPPQLAGLLFSMAGMVIGSLLPQFKRNDNDLLAPQPQ